MGGGKLKKKKNKNKGVIRLGEGKKENESRNGELVPLYECGKSKRGGKEKEWRCKNNSYGESTRKGNVRTNTRNRGGGGHTEETLKMVGVGKKVDPQ